MERHIKQGILIENMAYFSLDQFVQTVSKSGLARDNRFEVTIPGAPFESLLCESASLPGVNLVNRTQRLTGPAHIRPTNIEYGGVAQLTFYVDTDMRVKKYFDDWIHQAISPGSFVVNYQYKYATNIIITQLDENDEVTYAVTLIDAFPSAIAEMRVNHNSQSTFHRLGVSFSYRYWQTDDITNDVVDTPTIATSNVKTKPWEQIAEKAQPKGIARNVPTEPVTTPGGARILFPRP